MNLYVIVCSRCGVECVQDSIGRQCREYAPGQSDESIVNGTARRCGGEIVLKRLEDANRERLIASILPNPDDVEMEGYR